MMQARTMVVLAALVAGMSITSLLLVLLEPNPVSPPPGGILSKQDVRGTATTMAGKAYQKIADTAVPMRGWNRIVVHDSGAARGSAATLEAAFEELADQRAGYHFVINNGSIKDDGAIEIGYRWERQFDAVDALPDGLADARFNGTIAVCVIGDADAGVLSDFQEKSLFWLVQTLRQQLGEQLDVEFMLGDGAAGEQYSGRLAWQLRRAGS